MRTKYFTLLLLPSALRTYGRSSPATVHVIAPPFGASHLRSEFPGDSSCYCSSLRRFAPTVGVPRRQFMLLLLPSALRTYGRSLHEAKRSCGAFLGNQFAHGLDVRRLRKHVEG